MAQFENYATGTIATILEYDSATGRIRSQTVYDIGPELDHIDDMKRSIRQAQTNGFSRDRNYRFIGSIPAAVFFAHPEFMYDRKALRRFIKENNRFMVVDRGV